MSREITVVGAGILGLWQALELSRRGHKVRLVEATTEPFELSASVYAGAMLAPDCEAEAAPPLVRDLGRDGLALWRTAYPDVVNAGTLVVAPPRDRAELARFAARTEGHRTLSDLDLAKLEPDLAGRFSETLLFSGEAHLDPDAALRFLLHAARDAGADLRFGVAWTEATEHDGILIDCRGLAARDCLPTLRGVRGERIVVRTDEIRLARPVRLLHPRHPIYVVPWSGGRFLIGATMIESEDASPVSVRSALELLGTAYALHPSFAEAEIIGMGAGIRPAFPDNVPRAILNSGGTIRVNGAYRHGFLLAPVLAVQVAEFVESGRQGPLILRDASEHSK